MLPAHLKRYLVAQDYSRYTPVDQAVWRYIMHQLQAYLARHAHPCYLEGLEKTGISVDEIPHIEEMSAKLEKFGWRAVPVSGFIPPAAFMEMQAHGFLPIACDMRSVDHLEYTPAPDIVHEAAGHAPILVEPEFAEYLKSYAQVAARAIINHEDMAQYEAIRLLSDLKEDPASSAEQIQSAEEHLANVTKKISHLSEAAYLGRMNWWTAEYGLIGTLENPRIFGAGLLSSFGEARSCLSAKVKKLPLTIDCINYAYDITEQQPQLFVTPDFQNLRDVLEQLAAKMAFRVGGVESLEKAKVAQTVNTVELNSGLQISGRLMDYSAQGAQPTYLRFDGPTQLCVAGRQLADQGKSHHAQGFGTPLGELQGTRQCLSLMTTTELRALGIQEGVQAHLKFKSGVEVIGTVKSETRTADGRLVLISFTDCTVTEGSKRLFEPAWGIFDMATGGTVTSVFGGPAERATYGDIDDFVSKVIPRKTFSSTTLQIHRLYQAIQELRESVVNLLATDAEVLSKAESLFTLLEKNSSNDWLATLNLYEVMLMKDHSRSTLRERLKNRLEQLRKTSPRIQAAIDDGLKLLQ